MLLATGGLLAGTLASGVGAYENYRNVRIAHGQPTPKITELNRQINGPYGKIREQPSNAKPLWTNTNSKKTASHPLPRTTTSNTPTKYKNIPMSNLRNVVPQIRGNNRYFRNRVIRYVRRTRVQKRRRRRFSKKKQ